MSQIILIEGGTGTGKTTSIKNLPSEHTYLISVIPKNLPFAGWANKYQLSTPDKQGNRKIIFKSSFTTSNYKENKNLFVDSTKLVNDTLHAISERLPNIKYVIIDDSQYLMAFEFMARAREKGFEKYNELAQNFFDVLTTAQSLRDDITVFFLHHTEVTEGIRKAKTLGKMIDNYLTLEGLFNIVLLSDSRKVNGKIEYYFITNNDGTSTAKSPEGMFPSEIPNDLAVVIKHISAFDTGTTIQEGD